MIPNLPAYALGTALVASLAFGAVQCSQKQSARTDAASARQALAEYEASVATANARFEAEARATEQRHAADMSRIERETQDRLKEAGNDAYNRAVADVRAGRLRDVWSCPAAARVPDPSRAAAERDGPSGDKEDAVARVLRLGAIADERLSACQAVIRSDRNVQR